MGDEVVLPREEFRALLEAAAKAGARQALDEAGVADAVKLAKRVDGVADAVLKALAGGIVIGLLGAIWAGIVVLAKAKGG
ncbi:hypothetical protein KIF53_15260 [Chromobacterium subtsugae]|uniref:Uncharacterized protein n=2 Tax=Chromobacterium TaxID=535 RepID=A0ABS7FFY7_9NEIS|nr:MULTISPECIES: hypothetical protein [Chromobacterium]AUH51251.1 hypothetical protein CXB49_10735 [Chromobacterium sp. ATCC 53434]KUM02795.1 hypothetical protein Cv017_01720 [Chromobacterium subtsugae]KZE85011.1 hypothetical protein AWB61_03265 [Chromobacterium sp. F49]MBW7567764.1 hypothetical protein [Chromobacterium subtsugae]MBW8288990.1 hypothetical protein [Chromobacterium subtsugae]